MTELIRPFLPACIVFAINAALAPAFADRIDHGGVIELTGDDRPNAPTLAEFRCFETAAGWLFTDSVETARRTALGLRQASLRFGKYFGDSPPLGVVVTTASISSEMFADLGALGSWTLPWPIHEIENSTHADAFMHEAGRLWFIPGVLRGFSARRSVALRRERAGLVR